MPPLSPLLTPSTTHILTLSLTLFLLLLYSFFFVCVKFFVVCVCGNITMTDITDDIAEEISFQGFEDDCKLLGNLLNDILQREAGSTFVDKLEKIRVLSQSACNMRQAGMEDLAEMLEKQLASELSKMTLEEALPLALPLAIILL
ncbi:hypothetical protein GLYMA_02G118180v4 [Glycine max]|nr:hypothetical protein GLYMA_02G118180v4 [Glycine max]